MGDVGSYHRLIPVVALLVLGGRALAVSPGQIDTFGASTLNWIGGASPTHIASGGPDGDGDGYLKISRDLGFEFHLTTKNEEQWAGDYLAADIAVIDMDLNHLNGPDVVEVRLMLVGAGGTWTSTNRTPIAPGWNHYTLGLAAADLVYVNDITNSTLIEGGTGILDDTLSQLNVLLIRNDFDVPTAPGDHPPHIAAALGIDNVRAVVPEPTTFMLLGLGGLMLLRRRRAA